MNTDQTSCGAIPKSSIMGAISASIAGKWSSVVSEFSAMLTYEKLVDSYVFG